MRQESEDQEDTSIKQIQDHSEPENSLGMFFDDFSFFYWKLQVQKFMDFFCVIKCRLIASYCLDDNLKHNFFCVWKEDV